MPDVTVQILYLLLDCLVAFLLAKVFALYGFEIVFAGYIAVGAWFLCFRAFTDYVHEFFCLFTAGVQQVNVGWVLYVGYTCCRIQQHVAFMLAPVLIKLDTVLALVCRGGLFRLAISTLADGL